jgi:hypothetical protein
MTFSRILGLGSNDEKCDPIHVETQLKPNQFSSLFYNPILAKAGNASTLQPFYYTMNSFFRATIDAKDGDSTALRYFACNILACIIPGGRPFLMRTCLLCIQCKDRSLKHVRDSWISRYVLTLSIVF